MMSMDEAMGIYKRMTGLSINDMSARDQMTYFAVILRMAEEMKPFADKYAPEKNEENLPKPQSGVFRYIDGELRRLE